MYSDENIGGWGGGGVWPTRSQWAQCYLAFVLLCFANQCNAHAQKVTSRVGKHETSYKTKEGNVLFNDALNTFYYGYMASYMW